ncbi:hypothetical protein Tco_0401152 [Tanacetum coccineum]
MASVSIGRVSHKSLINHSLNGFWSHVVWVGVVRWGIRPGCPPIFISCLSSLEESLPYVPYVYGQSLAALPSQSAASGSETRVHTPAHGGSEAHNELPDLILPNEPKPLEKHKPPLLQLVLSPDELSYPP